MRLLLLVHIYKFDNDAWLYDRAEMADIELDSKEPIEMALALIDRMTIASKIAVTVTRVPKNAEDAFQTLWGKLGLGENAKYQLRPMSFQMVG